MGAPSYDDNAFYFFAVTVLSLYCVPTGMYLVGRTVSFLCRRPKPVPDAISAAQKRQFEEEQAKARSFSRLFTTAFTVNLVMFFVAMAILYVLMALIAQDGKVAVYDPHAILGVDTGASEREIKKAYRSLSLQFHPDKNPDDADAAEQFLKVAKAYEALTDPVSRENYEKYGNPDGKQALEVGLGLPTFFLDKGKQRYVLGVYVLLFIIAVPALVFCWYRRSSKYGDKNVMNVTYGYFFQMLKGNRTVRQLPEILISAPDFRETKVYSTSRAAREEIDKLAKRLHDAGHMQRPTQAGLAKHRLYALYVGLYAHLHNAPMIPPLQKDVDNLLRNSENMLSVMMEMVGMMIMGQAKQGANTAPLVRTLFAVMNFGARLTQGLGENQSELLQIPYFTEREVSHCVKGRAKCDTLVRYIHTQTDVADMKGTRDFSDAQKQEVFEFLRAVPDIKVGVDLAVEGEQGLCERDIITATITLTHVNLEEGQEVPPVHSPRFPYVKTEQWWVVIMDRDMRLLAQKAVQDVKSRETDVQLKFLAPPQGTHKYTVSLRCGSYVGLDQNVPLQFTTAVKRPDAQPHEDDLNIEDEGSIWDALAGQPSDSETDDDDNDDNDDDALGALGPEDADLTPAQRAKKLKRLQRKKAAAREDDGEEDADGDEETDDEDEDGGWQNVEAADGDDDEDDE